MTLNAFARELAITTQQVARPQPMCGQEEIRAVPRLTIRRPAATVCSTVHIEGVSTRVLELAGYSSHATAMLKGMHGAQRP